MKMISRKENNGLLKTGTLTSFLSSISFDRQKEILFSFFSLEWKFDCVFNNEVKLPSEVDFINNPNSKFIRYQGNF